MKTSLFFLAIGLAVAQAAKYQYIGCYRDNKSDRAFKYGPHTTTYQSVAKCAYHCSRVQNSQFFGLQNGNECYCGNAGFKRHGRLTEDRCNKCCVGDKRFPKCDRSSRCGSGWVNSVYKIVENTGAKFSYVGCFQDGKKGKDRTMTYSSTSKKLTVAGCVAQCKRAGYKYAGLQNANECFCSKKESFKRLGRLTEDRCNFCCQKKNNCEFSCGSGYVNSVYKVA